MRRDSEKLGAYSSVDVSGDGGFAPYEVKIINAYTQYNPGRDVNYEAIRKALRKIQHDLPLEATIGIPRIGAGIAGGDWRQIEDIIVTELHDRDVTIVSFIPQDN